MRLWMTCLLMKMIFRQSRLDHLNSNYSHFSFTTDNLLPSIHTFLIHHQQTTATSVSHATQGWSTVLSFTSSDPSLGSSFDFCWNLQHTPFTSADRVWPQADWSTFSDLSSTTYHSSLISSHNNHHLNETQESKSWTSFSRFQKRSHRSIEELLPRPFLIIDAM